MSRKLFAILFVGVGMIANVGCQSGCHHGCNNCNRCLPGCRPGPIGWQRGGTDYQRTLNHAAYAAQPAGSGVQSAQVGYPYYTSRGPRDFLMNNPPTIGR